MTANIINIFQNILEDYGMEKREELVGLVANEFGMSKHSVRSNWLSRREIPEYRQEKTLEMAQNFLLELNLEPQQ